MGTLSRFLIALISLLAMGCTSPLQFVEPPPPISSQLQATSGGPKQYYCKGMAGKYCGRPFLAGEKICPDCGSQLGWDGEFPPSSAGQMPPEPAWQPPVCEEAVNVYSHGSDQLSSCRLAGSDAEVGLTIADNTIWFDELWGDLYLEDGWREKLPALGATLVPAAAGYWCNDINVVTGPNCGVVKKWRDVYDTKAMRRKGGVAQQLDSLAKTMSVGASAAPEKLHDANGKSLSCHPQILFLKDRVACTTFQGVAGSKPPFTYDQYQRSY